MPYNVEVITLLPELWPSLLQAHGGVVGRAFAEHKAQLRVTALRDFGVGAHRQVDDTPYGGGPGMVLAVPPLHAAIRQARQRSDAPVILLSPRGTPFCQATAQALSQQSGLTLICGRFEGVDERVGRYVDAQLSLGSFVLSGGDPAAYAIIDAVVRLLPNVLGDAASLQEESFQDGTLEYPHYTRPATYEGQAVPSILRSGNHAAIAAWRQQQRTAVGAR